jgi:hypothetical protein
VLAFAFVVLALAVGLRAIPIRPALSPIEAAALVLARAVVALGLFAFGHTLLRMAERFFVGRAAPQPPPTND